MATENSGLKIFNKWIKDNNQIHKFTKDTKYDDILPVMFKTISAEQQASVLKSFIEKKLLRPDTISRLNEIIRKKTRELKIKSWRYVVREERIRNTILTYEIFVKYGDFIDASANEISRLDKSDPSQIRKIFIRIFVGVISKWTGSYKIIQMCELLMIIKDHARKYELFQAMTPTFKYIFNAEENEDLRFKYRCINSGIVCL